MEIKTKFNIGDDAYYMFNMNIYRVTIDNIHIKINKSFKEIHQEISYDVVAHTDGYMNFIPSNLPVEEKFLFNTPQELINNIKIVK